MMKVARLTDGHNLFDARTIEGTPEQLEAELYELNIQAANATDGAFWWVFPSNPN